MRFGKSPFEAGRQGQAELQREQDMAAALRVKETREATDEAARVAENYLRPLCEEIKKKVEHAGIGVIQSGVALSIGWIDWDGDIGKCFVTKIGIVAISKDNYKINLPSGVGGYRDLGWLDSSAQEVFRNSSFERLIDFDEAMYIVGRFYEYTTNLWDSQRQREKVKELKKWRRDAESKLKSVYKFNYYSWAWGVGLVICGIYVYFGLKIPSVGAGALITGPILGFIGGWIGSGIIGFVGYIVHQSEARGRD